MYLASPGGGRVRTTEESWRVHTERDHRKKVTSYPNQDVSVYFNGNVHFEVLVIEFYRQHPIRVKTWGPKRSS